MLQLVVGCPGQERLNSQSCYHRREELDKSSLIHSFSPSSVDICNRNSLFLTIESAAIVHLFLIFLVPIRLVELEWPTRTTLKTCFCQSSASNSALWDKEQGASGAALLRKSCVE